MSYFANLEDGSQIFLSSNSGYGQLGSWIESLPDSQFPELAEFWSEGVCGDCLSLADELDSAFRKYPASKDVKTIVFSLFNFLKDVGEDEVLTITQ